MGVPACERIILKRKSGGNWVYDSVKLAGKYDSVKLAGKMPP
jgi:hypothetical protein